MFLRMDSRLAFVALFGSAQLLGACAKKKAKKSDAVEQSSDAGSGDQAPPPDEDGGGGEDAPGQTDQDDKSVDDKDDAPPPKDDGSTSPSPSPYGQALEPTVASIQTKLLDVYCVKCHQGTSPRAGLDLTSLQAHLDGTAAGTYEGRLVVPGHEELSALVLVIDPAVDHDGAIKWMPPLQAGIPAVTGDQVQVVKAFVHGLGGQTDLSLPGTPDADGSDAPVPPADGSGEAGDAGGADRGDALDPGFGP